MSNYIVGTFRFNVDLGGTSVGFQEVSGLSQETEVISYRHGAMVDGAAPMKSPGQTKYSDGITLKKGYFKGDSQMEDWLKAIRTDETARRTVIISLLDEQQQPVITWTVYKAWPSKIDGLTLDATSSQGAIATIKLEFEGLDCEIHS